MSRHFARGGGGLEYEVRGDGPDLLLLHAFPFDLSIWDDVVAELAPHARSLRFSARGFGASSPAGALLSMEGIAADAVALMDHLGVSRALVCGLSMGGYAALAMVRAHAPRVTGLALCDTRAEADSPEARSSRSALAAAVRAQGVGPVVEAMLPKLLGATTHRERPAVVARTRAAMERCAPAAVADALAGLAARADQTGFLREIRVPTLCLAGEEDVLTPPADARRMADAIPGARLVLLPGSGHLPCFEAPAALAEHLREQLAARP